MLKSMLFSPVSAAENFWISGNNGFYSSGLISFYLIIFMVIGYGIIQLIIPEICSLKEKRSVLSRIIKRTRNNFNVGMAEIGDLDNHNFAQIGFAIVGNDSRFVNGKVDHLLRFVDDLQIAEIVHSKIEIMVVDDFLEAGNWEKGKYDEF